ncbi:hypothetical protein CEUSTIGMA_g13181.t1 [Chlamydomonas eustigma]|uniref:Chlorophyllase n=1 Tax=Chlamydomonas eustigma TaxID=1157962 RepID=A0A250XRU6_9CHLO|nr:hypothetical protein CEUSTIGMA_g13181.t1 [Chlamydomonas eustigma]|eukprot:GAX85766.1 hypothetical protein CEUSTIGMA_g13181.t1 [Chlamydomonas eustigma]
MIREGYFVRKGASFPGLTGCRTSSQCSYSAARKRAHLKIFCSSSARSEASKYLNKQGPFRGQDLNPINLRVGTNPEGAPLTAQLQVSVPLGPSNCPLVIVSAGFLLDGTSYRSYCQDLASWGYVAVLYDVSELLDDRQMVAAIRTMMDCCAADPQVNKVYSPEKGVLLVGHSRGGKLSVLAAAEDSRVQALVLLDPVNNTAMTPSGPGYPSALPLLRQLTSTSSSRGRAPLPTLIVGAARNQDVVPEDAGYRRFLEACVGPAWFLEVQAGHLQFLDRQAALFSMFSAPGPLSDATVRSISKAAMLAWFQEVHGASLATSQAVQSSSGDTVLLQRSLELEASCFKSLAPGTSSVIRGLNLLSRQGATPARETSSSGNSTGASESSYSRSSNSSSSSQQSSGSYKVGVKKSYEELLSMRASALKAILLERSIPCQDCFDKESLARRVLERCS